MLEAQFNNFTDGNLKWFSGIAPMALLNWGFDTPQMAHIYTYRNKTIPLETPISFLNSYAYLISGFTSITPSKYLYFSDLDTDNPKLPDLSTPYKAYLARFTDITLHKWGFSASLINEIYTIACTNNPKEPVWLEDVLNYKEAEYTLINAPLRPVSHCPLREHGLSSELVEERSQESDEPYTLTNTMWSVHNAPIFRQRPQSPPISITIATPRSALETHPSTLDTAHDIQVKYLHTYGMYQGKPIYITDIFDHDTFTTRYKINFRSINTDGCLMSSQASYDIAEFNMLLPKLGFINHANMAFFLERSHKKSSPSRYRKGLRADTLLLDNLSTPDYAEVYGSENIYNIRHYSIETMLRKIIHSLFSPEYFTYQGALESLLSFKKFSCAISSTIALRLDFKTNKVVLYRNTFPIGIYRPSKKGIVLNTNIFNDDLIKLGVIIK